MTIYCNKCFAVFVNAQGRAMHVRSCKTFVCRFCGTFKTERLSNRTRHIEICSSVGEVPAFGFGLPLAFLDEFASPSNLVEVEGIVNLN